MTILYSEAIMITPGWYIVLVVILFFASILIALVGAAFFEDTSGKILESIAFICLIIFMILLCGDYKIDSGKKQYNVIFNEKQDLMEFNSKYRIIEQKGEMFVIRDR